MTPDAVVTALKEAGGSGTAAAVADALGIHVTTARYHLDRLAASGIVHREVAHDGSRGRPSLSYLLVDSEGARQELITVLAHALSRGEGADRATAAGASWADAVRIEHSDPVDVVVHEFARLGFEPSRSQDCIELRACPFRDAARAAPGVVCAVHAGLAQRLAERASDSAVRVTLEPFVTDELCRIGILSP